METKELIDMLERYGDNRKPRKDVDQRYPKYSEEDKEKICNMIIKGREAMDSTVIKEMCEGRGDTAMSKEVDACIDATKKEYNESFKNEYFGEL